MLQGIYDMVSILNMVLLHAVEMNNEYQGHSPRRVLLIVAKYAKTDQFDYNVEFVLLEVCKLLKHIYDWVQFECK